MNVKMDQEAKKHYSKVKRQMKKIGTYNEVRAILNLAPIPGGDQAVRRLDTAPINEKKEVNGNAEN